MFFCFLFTRKYPKHCLKVDADSDGYRQQHSSIRQQRCDSPAPMCRPPAARAPTAPQPPPGTAGGGRALPSAISRAIPSTIRSTQPQFLNRYILYIQTPRIIYSNFQETFHLTHTVFTVRSDDGYRGEDESPDRGAQHHAPQEVSLLHHQRGQGGGRDNKSFQRTFA